MDDDQRKSLYTSLLRGLANTAQDRLCEADEQHAWGPWKRYQVVKDIPPVRPLDLTIEVCSETVLVRSERACENCGKVQRD